MDWDGLGLDGWMDLRMGGGIEHLTVLITITHTGQDRGWTWADIAEVLLKRRRG